MTAFRKNLSRALQCCLFSPIAAGMWQSADAFELEMGNVAVADTFAVASWTSVTFAEPFQSPPLVFVLPTDEGSDPATIRIRNVTSTGFEVVQTADADGFDAQVDAVRITLTGQLASIATSGAPSFELLIAARVK